uniref:Uncharacterized protein n=1 Tax=Oryza nivara TaxID=4536 RepID=A0A0E0GN19_ORYNI
MDGFVLTVSAVWGRRSSAAVAKVAALVEAAAVVDEAEEAAGVATVLAMVAALAEVVVAVLAEVAALVEAAVVLAEVAAPVDKRRRSWRRWRRRRSWTRRGGGGRGRGNGAQGGGDTRGRTTEFAEVADGTVTPFARPRWEEFVRQFFTDQLVLDLKGIFLSRDQPIPPTPKPNIPKSGFAPITSHLILTTKHYFIGRREYAINFCHLAG